MDTVPKCRYQNGGETGSSLGMGSGEYESIPSINLHEDANDDIHWEIGNVVAGTHPSMDAMACLIWKRKYVVIFATLAMVLLIIFSISIERFSRNYGTATEAYSTRPDGHEISATHDSGDIRNMKNVDIIDGDCSSNEVASSGVYIINMKHGDRSLTQEVYCVMAPPIGGWTVLLRRTNGATEFDRDWQSYKNGFGSLTGEFWAGNELIHFMTSRLGVKFRLRIELTNYFGEYRFAEYDHFAVDDEYNNYTIHVKSYSGNATDALSTSDGLPMSTTDRDNDLLDDFNCARFFHGAWWYGGCGQAWLTGLYGRDLGNSQGIVWGTWLGWEQTIKRVEMRIRPT